VTGTTSNNFVGEKFKWFRAVPKMHSNVKAEADYFIKSMKNILSNRDTLL